MKRAVVIETELVVADLVAELLGPVYQVEIVPQKTTAEWTNPSPGIDVAIVAGSLIKPELAKKLRNPAGTAEPKEVTIVVTYNLSPLDHEVQALQLMLASAGITEVHIAIRAEVDWPGSLLRACGFDYKKP